MTSITLIVDGTSITCPADISVMALLMQHHLPTRQSVTGTARAPVCGMGICYECRVTIDDVPHQLACQRIVSAGMHITTATPRGAP